MLTKRPLAIPRSQRPSVPHRATFLTRISCVIDWVPDWARVTQCNKRSAIKEGGNNNYQPPPRRPLLPLVFFDNSHKKSSNSRFPANPAATLEALTARLRYQFFLCSSEV